MTLRLRLENLQIRLGETATPPPSRLPARSRRPDGPGQAWLPGPRQRKASTMRPAFLTALLCLPILASGAAPEPPLRHARAWLHERLQQMLACDEAYLYNDVLGGRAIHQNSMSKPEPTEPWEGNFHTQQQSYYALLKLDLYELGGRQQALLLDQARALLDWVVTQGYDAEKRQFYLKYSSQTGAWEKGFFPEFNLISVAGLLCYTKYRPDPAWHALAEGVLEHILETDAFVPGKPKGLYASGYLALKLLDCYDTLQDERFLKLARQVVDLADAALWDLEYGGWFLEGKAGGELPKHTTKFTHTNANLIQACLRLNLAGQGEPYRARALAALRFLAEHSRSPDGGWYRHTTRAGTDPTLPPGIGDGGTTEPGTPCVYDRMAQMIVACCLAWQASADPTYLQWVDETLDKMEKTHLTRYPIGVNYGYTGAGDYQNTWCHLWGLKAFIQMLRLWP